MSNISITWQFQMAIPGGPSFAINQPAIAVQAYDVASATVPAATNNVPVVIQPSTASGDVVLVVVSSDTYDSGLSYTVDALGKVHALDGPHVLLGSGAVGFMNDSAPPQKLTFSSTLGKNANVQVVVGRKNP